MPHRSHRRWLPALFLLGGASISSAQDVLRSVEAENYLRDVRALHRLAKKTKAGMTVSTAPEQLLGAVFNAERLKAASPLLLHGSTSFLGEVAQVSELGIAAWTPRADVRPIPYAFEYLRFIEFSAVLTELLDRRSHVRWVIDGDDDLQAHHRKRLCLVPSALEFQRKVLSQELSDGRYPLAAMRAAQAVEARLAQRIDWYASEEHQRTCADPGMLRIAP